MNNLAQLRYEMPTDDPRDSWIEPTDEHEEMAIAELADDPGALWDVLESSPFCDEFVSYLFTHCEDFRATVLRENADRIKARAQEIADLEYKSQEEEAATRYCA